LEVVRGPYLGTVTRPRDRGDHRHDHSSTFRLFVNEPLLTRDCIPMKPLNGAAPMFTDDGMRLQDRVPSRPNVRFSPQTGQQCNKNLRTGDGTLLQLYTDDQMAISNRIPHAVPVDEAIRPCGSSRSDEAVQFSTDVRRALEEVQALGRRIQQWRAHDHDVPGPPNKIRQCRRLHPKKAVRLSPEVHMPLGEGGCLGKENEAEMLAITRPSVSENHLKQPTVLCVPRGQIARLPSSSIRDFHQAG
jgi:hypothetical protein